MKGFCERDESTSQVTLGTSDNRAMMEEYQKKFLKEARLIARLDHPNITRIHDVFTENNTAYYVMEYIDGANLNELVKEKGALSETEALRYIRQVGEGLEYVHAHKINHLDIKPGNIMLRKDGRPVLIDFGMSKQYDESGDQTSSTPIGVSAGYAPLELYQAGGVSAFSPQTDIYELAATLYRLVTGNVPPVASDVMNDGISEKPAHVSKSTWMAIEKGMSFKKIDRPSSVQEFLALLSETPSDDEETSLIQEKPNPAAAQAAAPPVKKKGKKWLVTLGAGGAVIIAIIALLSILNSNKEDAHPIPTPPDPVENTTTSESAPQIDRHTESSVQSASKPATTATESDPAAPASPQKDTKTTGTAVLPFGTYSGPCTAGKPNGEGKVTISKAYSLDDQRGHTFNLEPGDYLDAEFKNGQLLNAYWYGADKKKKGTIVIGQ